MDRSQRRHGFVWVGVAIAALLAPACSDVSSSPTPVHDRGSSRVVREAESPALALRVTGPSERGRPGLLGSVVPAAHLFSPPPLPSSEGEASDAGEPLLHDGEGIVRMAPEPAPSARSSHAPRRLPQLDSSPMFIIEPNSGQATAAPADRHSPDDAAADLKHLPPPPEIDESAGSAAKWSGEEAGNLRRLPAVELDWDRPNSDAEVRRLPSAAAVAESVADDTGVSHTDQRDGESAPTQAGTATTRSLDTGPVQYDSPSQYQSNEQVPQQLDTAEGLGPILELPVLEAPMTEIDADDESTLTGETARRRGQTTDETTPSEAILNDMPRASESPRVQEPATPADPLPEMAESGDSEVRHLPPLEEEPGEPSEHRGQLSPPLFESEEALPVAPDEMAPPGEYVLPQAPHASVPPVLDDPTVVKADSPIPLAGESELPGVDVPVNRPLDVVEPPRAWLPVAVPVIPCEPDGALLVKATDATFEVVARRVGMLSRRSEDLASRGAYFAARAEMIKALRVITQALDAQLGVKTHSEALGRGMRALQEASDFAPQGSQLESELNLARIVSGHRTTELKDEHLERLTPLAAQQRYLEYAQEQFALAGGGLPAASHALYGLARIYTVMEHAKMEKQTLCLPIAVTLHQAALLVDASNVKAANELGVLLARFGQWEDARRVLQHAVSIRSESEIWHNLAVIHQRLGEAALAQQARQQYHLTAARQPDDAGSDRTGSVQWVDAKTFSQVTPASMP